MKNLIPKKSKILLDYASDVYRQYKQMRYGLSTCAVDLDDDIVYMRKHLVEWQSNEDLGALTDVSYNYQLNTTYLPLTYHPTDMEATVGGPLTDPTLGGAGFTQSFGYYSPFACRQDMTNASVTNVNYNTGNGQSGSNVIDINTGGCVTRINLSNTVNLKTQSFEYIQDVAATVWDIQHNLGFNPNVRTEDSTGTDILGSIQHLSVNRLKITFNQAVAGTAYLS